MKPGRDAGTEPAAVSAAVPSLVARRRLETIGRQPVDGERAARVAVGLAVDELTALEAEARADGAAQLDVREHADERERVGAVDALLDAVGAGQLRRVLHL